MVRRQETTPKGPSFTLGLQALPEAETAAPAPVASLFQAPSPFAQSPPPGQAKGTVAQPASEAVPEQSVIEVLDDGQQRSSNGFIRLD
eukprot:s9_g25.t1